MSSIVVKDLKLNFGSVEVLKNLSVDVAEGEFIVLLGPSGCGKSTLLNCIAGLLDVTDGQIFINDKNVTWEEPKDRGIGMVFQSYALYPQMSVRGNLSFGLKNQRMPKAEIEQRVARAAEILQIEDLLDRRPKALSGGQRQRVAIGRALVRDVDVFLFDEPLSNLDAKLRSELRVEIKRLHARLANTMVYVTHDQIEALTLADRIAVMREGLIQQLDTPAVIYNRPNSLYVAGFIGSPSMNFVDAQLLGSGSDRKVRLGDTELSLARYDAEGDLGENRSVVLGLRPEHVRLTPGQSDDFVSVGEATVDIVEPMGSDSLVWVNCQGFELSARVESSETFAAGDKVPLSLNIAVASIYDAKTENRI